jgi:hypothetical protein
MSGEQPAGAAADNVTTIYHDAAVAELLCQYPNAAIVELAATDEHGVTIILNGQPVRLRARNADTAEVGGQYLYIQSGADAGLYLTGDE